MVIFNIVYMLLSRFLLKNYSSALLVFFLISFSPISFQLLIFIGNYFL